MLCNFCKDQVRLDCETNKIRSDMKVRVNNLREKEGLGELNGFNLQALSREEANGIRHVIETKQGSS